MQPARHAVYLIDGYRLSRCRDSLGIRAKIDASDAGLLRRRAVPVRVRVTLQQSMADMPLLGSSVRGALEHIDRVWRSKASGD